MFDVCPTARVALPFVERLRCNDTIGPGQDPGKFAVCLLAGFWTVPGHQMLPHAIHAAQGQCVQPVAA